MVVYTCNPSYTGGRDQEDCSLIGQKHKTLFENKLKAKRQEHGLSGGMLSAKS
jgi:hypothetical protein